MDPHSNLAATIDAWRERGAHSFDPVRFRFIEALATRAANRGGPVRRILDDKLAKLLTAYADDLEKARGAQNNTGHCAAAPACATAPDALPSRGALAELVDHIGRHASAHEDGRPSGDLALGVGPPAELKTLRYFRSTWSRLSAHRRLTQSLAKMPENAGPLNSHHLVHQSLALMRDLSPEYLDRFMSYVDALLWLEQANGAPRADGDKKAARGRSG